MAGRPELEGLVSPAALALTRSMWYGALSARIALEVQEVSCNADAVMYLWVGGRCLKGKGKHEGV